VVVEEEVIQVQKQVIQEVLEEVELVYLHQLVDQVILRQ
jgi:hypothetical protein